MLSTQPKALPPTGTTLDPLRSRALAPNPQYLALIRHYKLALQQEPSAPSSIDSQSATLREYAESCAQLPFSLHATDEAGQRRMMRGADEHASSEPTSTEDFEFIFATHTTTQPPLPFGTNPVPDMGLTFLPRPQPRPRKRSRAAADIDGEHSCMQKKKRRLRLFLITSRLSPQFSHPATNIVDRGSSKIAVWAKQKSLGRNLLRKAAILNHIRRRSVCSEEADGKLGCVLVEQERERKELALATLEFKHGSVDTYTRPVTSRNPSVPPAAAIRSGDRFIVSGSPTGSPTSSRSPSPTPPSPPLDGIPENRHPVYSSPNEAYEYPLPRAQLPRRDYLPLPPSPLGLSNYDAFDADGDIPDPYSHFDDDDDEPSTYLFGDDENADTVPFSPSAGTSTLSSTMQTRDNQALETPPQNANSTSSTLNHAEPVLGDYDQVEEGAGTVWPSTLAQEHSAATTGSTLPDFNALFATAPSKRADSFATSPNFRPTIAHASISPNFLPTTSASFTASTSRAPLSPNFTPTTLPTSTSPNFTPSNTSTFAGSTTPPASPNFLALDAPSGFGMSSPQRRMSMPTNPRPGGRPRRNTDVEQQHSEQRELFFSRFGS